MCIRATALIFAANAATIARAQANSSSWTGGGTDSLWSDSLDWNAGIIPGATSGTTNGDTATFNAAAGAGGALITVDSGRNIGSITFDNSSSTLPAYTIGLTTGNSLILSSGGLIQTTSSVSTAETIAAPLQLQNTAAGTSGAYTFSSNATVAALGTTTGPLVFSGAITGSATSGSTTLTLTGTMPNIQGDSAGEYGGAGSRVTGIIGNGSGGGNVALVVDGLTSGSQIGGWVLSGANTYTGGTTVGSGQLWAANAAALGTGPVSVAAGAQLSFGAAGLSVANALTLNGLATNLNGDNGALAGDMLAGGGSNTFTGTITLNATSNFSTSWSDKSMVLTGQITGAGGLEVDVYHTGNNGSQVYITNNTNNYAGPTIINGGAGSNNMLYVGNGGATGVLGVGGVTVASGGSIVFDRNNAMTVANAISGAGVVEQLGAGVAQLTGALSYTGATDINGGALNVGANLSLLNLSSNVVFDGGALETSGTFTESTGTTGGTIQFAGSGGFSANGGPLSVNVGGNATPTTLAWGTQLPSSASLLFGSIDANNVTTLQNGLDLKGGARTMNVTAGAGGDSAVLAAPVIDSTGGGSLTVTGSGALTFGAVNTYTGGTTVSNTATLNLGVAGSLGPSTAPLTVNGGVLNLNGFSTGVGTFSGSAGSVANNAASTAATFTIGNGASPAAGTFAGNIVDNSTGSGGTIALDKVGTNNVTLGGTNSYSGGTTISAGALTVATPGNLGSGAVNLAGGTLAVNFSGNIGLNFDTNRGAGTYPVTGSAGVVPISNWNNQGALNQSTPLALSNSTGLNSGATVTWSGVVDHYDAFGASEANQNSQLVNAYLDHSSSASPIQITLANVLYSSYNVYVYLSSDQNGRTASVSIGGTTYYYGTEANGGGTNAAVNLVQTTSTSSGSTPSANYAEFTNVTGSSFTITQTLISGNSGVAGVEIVGNAPATFANSLQLTANSTLSLTGAATATFGDLTSTANNTLFVTGASTGANIPYELTLGAVTLTGSPTFDVANNGTGLGTLAVAAITGGANGFTKADAGELLLTAAGAYSGPTSVTGGTLQVTTDGALGSSIVSIASAATLILGGGTTNSYIGVAGGLSLASGATIELDYSGADTVSSLSVGGTSLGPGTYTVSQLIADGANSASFGAGTITVVPEPSTLILTSASLAGWAIALCRRRRGTGSRKPAV